MRIDIVTDTFHPDVNGVAMTLGRLAEGLRERGHIVGVLHTAEGEAGAGGTLASVPLPGYKEVRVGLPSGFKLMKRWRRKRPEVVYVATESPLGYSALRVAKAMRIPVATGFHTDFEGYLRRYRLSGLAPAAQAYLHRVHRRADCTFAPSAEVVERLVEAGLPDVRLLGRGVDTDLFSPGRRSAALRAGWGARCGTPVAITVGRVAPEKNLPLAMRAFEALRSRIPDVRCVVVGEGPIRARLERAHPSVHFAGMKSGEELAQYYASADLFLFPSETETFGNVLLEAMASGLVTVSYDYAAAAQHVEQGRNGWKVPLGDEDGFSEAAVRALDPADRARIGQAARETAEGLGWEQVLSVFEGELARLAGEAGSSRAGRKTRAGKLLFRAVFLSDLHLGTRDAKAREVNHFLKHLRCERLVLNGDIVDGWSLRRGGRWEPSHTRLVRTILKMGEKSGTEVIYLRGNHDEVLDRFLPLHVGGIQFGKELIHETACGRRYLVVHGDGFDHVTTHHPWLSRLGAVGYDLLLAFNRFYNRYRAWRGKDYFSMSKAIKARVKAAVSWVDRYQAQLQQYARRRHCDGIICGHIHTPADEQVGEVHYLNSGDWVETLSAVVEHLDGRLEVLTYEDFLVRLARSEENGVPGEERPGAILAERKRNEQTPIGGTC